MRSVRETWRTPTFMGQVEGEKDEDGEERQRVPGTNQGARKFQEREKMWQVRVLQGNRTKNIERFILRN